MRWLLSVLLGGAAAVGYAAGLLALIPLAAFGHWLGIELLIVVGFLAGVLTVFFDVAYQSYLPVLVNRVHLVEGNSKLEVTNSMARIEKLVHDLAAEPDEPNGERFGFYVAWHRR